MNNSIAAKVHQVAADYIFGIVIFNFFQIPKFPFLICFRNQVSYLDIQLFFSLSADEIDFTIFSFPYFHFIAS